MNSRMPPPAPEPMPFGVKDLVGIFGVLSVLAGVAWLNRSAALIVGGLLLLFYAYVTTPKAPPRAPQGGDRE